MILKFFGGSLINHAREHQKQLRALCAYRERLYLRARGQRKLRTRGSLWR